MCYNGYCFLEVVMNIDEIIYRNLLIGVGYVVVWGGGVIFFVINIFFNLYKEKGIL